MTEERSAASPDAAAPEEDSSDPSAPEETQTELEAALARAESNLAHWQRAQADFQNYKRRAEQERGELLRFASAGLLLQILSTVDDLERALWSIPVSLHQLTWVEGIRLIHRKLLAQLESNGVKEIEANGQPFDPTMHEAISRMPGPDGQIIEVLQKGYLIHDRVLRPALVQVGDGAADREGSFPTAAEQQNEDQKD